MNAKQKRLWKLVCSEILSEFPEDQAGRFIKLLLDWRDAERAELLEALQRIERTDLFTTSPEWLGNFCRAAIAKAERGEGR